MPVYYSKYPWYVHAENERQYLQVTRFKDSSFHSVGKRDWTPDEVDFEMSFGKDPTQLEIFWFTQECLEYFVSRYPKTYEHLYFNNATMIRDWSPLADLPNLKGVSIHWCRADRLWDMSRNTKLTNLYLNTTKKIACNLSDLQTCPSIENVFISGDMDTSYRIPSLSCFADLPNLRRIDLTNIKVEDHDLSFLKSLPSLEEFHFDPGMLTTEEITYICANYPNLYGRSLGAYTTYDYKSLNDIRICGYRKPGLNLPEQQARFDKYVAEFNALIEKYKEKQ
ncbi:MAG: hypothetical protein IJX47_03550 [Clostridia bacterium]|nr:hypothetical protein [Clostridia bacterium]